VYLKSLVLKGFKSFADRSVLSLEPGLTVVVGPNGSGKSNISDAVLWVLGEQSPKHLRGDSMEDVIFSGSSARKAVSVAEVDLVLDNADGTLPVDFEEVVLTRRMYRSGQSEYLINGSPCRLLDIRDILHDSGLGRDTHTIISQGSLQDVLDARPEDRRLLIEEAAGILKHRERKQRSARKVDAMDAHLERVHDVQREVQRQLKPLERQASRAKQHDEIADELCGLELSLAVDDLRNLQGLWGDATKVEKEAEGELDVARLTLSDREQDLEKRQRVLEEKGMFVGDLTEQRQRWQSVVERLDAGIRLIEEKGNNLVDRLSTLQTTITMSERRLHIAKDEVDGLVGERDESNDRFTALHRQLADLQRESEAVRKERRAGDVTYSKDSESLRNRQKALADCRSRLAKVEEGLANFDFQDDLLAKRVGQLDEQNVTDRAMLAERREHLEQIEGNLTTQRREAEAVRFETDTRVRVLDDRRATLTALRDRRDALRAEAKGLEEVDRAFEAASPALASVLADEGGYPGVKSPVSELFHAPEDLEHLVEHLLGADLFGLLVGDADDAVAIVGRLLATKSAEQGEIALVPVSGSHPFLSANDCARAARRGVRLIDQLTYDSSLEEAAQALLGDVYVVDDIKVAVDAVAANPCGARYVTRDGAVAWPNGKVTLGMQVNDIDGVLTRKRRMMQVTDEIAQVTEQVSDAELALSEAERALKASQESGYVLAQGIAQLSGESDSLHVEVGRLEKQLVAHMREGEDVARQRVDITRRRESTQPLAGELRNRIEVIGQEADEIERRIAEGATARRDRFEHENSLSKQLSSCQVEIATIAERKRHLDDRVKALTNEVAELNHVLDVSHATERSLDVLRLRVAPLSASYRMLSQGAVEKAKMLQDRARLEQVGSKSLTETIEVSRAAVHDAKGFADAAAEKLSAARVEKGRCEAQVDAAVQRIVREQGVPLDRALEVDPPENRRATEDHVLRLKRRLSNLGPVNPVARQEYETLRARSDYIDAQVTDLDAARKALAHIVSAIDRKMRSAFLTTFNEIDRNFQQVFADLFPGGTASLSLTNPDDPDGTGVVINAQPRGKMIRSTKQMSGGETSLTAIALLFAIYRVHHVPFYILDEVEAALDDTNLLRLVTFLDGVRDDTQLVMVSHQRRTMEMADVLYGVSMQADGVSKLVSQRLDHSKPAVELHATLAAFQQERGEV
jgi:chromosome segregation protein